MKMIIIFFLNKKLNKNKIADKIIKILKIKK